MAMFGRNLDTVDYDNVSLKDLGCGTDPWLMIMVMVMMMSNKLTSSIEQSPSWAPHILSA